MRWTWKNHELVVLQDFFWEIHLSKPVAAHDEHLIVYWLKLTVCHVQHQWPTLSVLMRCCVRFHLSSITVLSQTVPYWDATSDVVTRSTTTAAFCRRFLSLWRHTRSLWMTAHFWWTSRGSWWSSTRVTASRTSTVALSGMSVKVKVKSLPSFMGPHLGSDLHFNTT